MNKYDPFKKSDMNKMLKNMKTSSDKDVHNQLLNAEHDFICPKCDSAIKVKIGENTCPNCGQGITLKSDF